MGALYVVGFGPGDAGNMTENARLFLEQADVIVGYSGYIKLLRPLFPDKCFYHTGMTGERERCLEALRLAKEGKQVALVSSGDGGVYGMASLIYELAEEDAGIPITVIPGVTAALSGAALLGAPLGHDFAVVSLSDLLTPWDVIEKRLRAAASADFALCLYNPGSRARAGHLQSACDILLECIPASRLCGIAHNIGRAGQAITLLNLGELRNTAVGMEDTVFIGNTSTRMIRGGMVTPRGYLHE